MVLLGEDTIVSLKLKVKVNLLIFVCSSISPN